MSAAGQAWDRESVHDGMSLEAAAHVLGCEVVREPMPRRLKGVCIPGSRWPVVFLSAACTAGEQSDYLKRMAQAGFEQNIWYADAALE
jgi:hypothetical protein